MREAVFEVTSHVKRDLMQHASYEKLQLTSHISVTFVCSMHHVKGCN